MLARVAFDRTRQALKILVFTVFLGLAGAALFDAIMHYGYGAPKTFDSKQTSLAVLIPWVLPYFILSFWRLFINQTAIVIDPVGLTIARYLRLRGLHWSEIARLSIEWRFMSFRRLRFKERWLCVYGEGNALLARLPVRDLACDEQALVKMLSQYKPVAQAEGAPVPKPPRAKPLSDTPKSPAVPKRKDRPKKLAYGPKRWR